MFTSILPADVLYPKTVLLFTRVDRDPMVIVKYAPAFTIVASALDIADPASAGVSATYTSFVVSSLYMTIVWQLWGIASVGTTVVVLFADACVGNSVLIDNDIVISLFLEYSYS